jgi:hypothetical protein
MNGNFMISMTAATLLANWPFDLSFSDWAVAASLLCGVLLALGIVILWRGRFGKRSPPTAGAHVALLPHDPFAHGSATDKRHAPRRRGSPVSVMVSDDAGTALPWQGTVVDRSVAGLRLEMDNSVAVGSVLSVRPAQAPAIVPWIQVEARFCKKTGNAWHVGCRFLRPPPSNVLWLFG